MVKSKTILIIDDEKGVKTLIKMIMLSKKCRFEYCHNVAKAEEMLKTKEYDLVLLDIIMEGSSGFDLLEKLKKNNPKQKVIVVSGLKGAEYATRAFKMGAVDYITKPFDYKDFKRKICDAVEME